MSIGGGAADTIIDIASGGPIGDAVFGEEGSDILGDPLDLFGRRAAGDIADAEAEQLAALDEATRQEILAREAAQGFFEPFAGVAERGVELSSFLTDPQQQFDFIQNNPFFQASLQNANRATDARAAAGGRLGAGDTLQQLSSNFLTTAQPLIDRQSQGILDLLGLGQGIATSQANTAIGQGTALSGLAQNAGNVRAASQAAQAQNQAQSTQNIAQLGGAILAAFSDSRLKANAEIVSKENGYNVWKWDWNGDAWEKFGLRGSSRGVMVSDVLEKDPDAVSYEDGYGKVNYTMIGVKNG
jgi:hypothetical protein